MYSLFSVEVGFFATASLTAAKESPTPSFLADDLEKVPWPAVSLKMRLPRLVKVGMLRVAGRPTTLPPRLDFRALPFQ
jgi:hypothetical protein